MALPAKTKVVIVPAMNTEMWNNPIVQKNVETLKQQKAKYIFVDPQKGMLACRDEGVGKLADNQEILKIVKEILSKK